MFFKSLLVCEVCGSCFWSVRIKADVVKPEGRAPVSFLKRTAVQGGDHGPVFSSHDPEMGTERVCRPRGITYIASATD